MFRDSTVCCRTEPSRGSTGCYWTDTSRVSTVSCRTEPSSAWLSSHVVCKTGLTKFKEHKRYINVTFGVTESMLNYLKCLSFTSSVALLNWWNTAGTGSPTLCLIMEGLCLFGLVFCSSSTPFPFPPLHLKKNLVGLAIKLTCIW
jgi:hypothetical protein